MIIEKILETKQANIKQAPVHTNRASQLGHPCIRYLVFERTRWNEKILHGASLQMVFDIGNDFEDRVIKDLKDAGFQVMEQQRAFFWKDYNISGHIDAKLMVDGVVYPIEVKSMSPFAFDKVDGIDDMLNSKYAYMRQYPAQMMLYLLMDNKERGIFLLKNKVTGAMKEIIVDLDYALGESLLQKAEAINKHVAGSTLPDPIEWDDHICGDCGYQHICMPDRIGKEVEMVDDTELEELIGRYEQLKPAAKEYEEVDKRISEIVKGRDKLLVGNWFITGTWRNATRYDVPKELKDQYAVQSRYWVKKIMRAA